MAVSVVCAEFAVLAMAVTFAIRGGLLPARGREAGESGAEVVGERT